MGETFNKKDKQKKKAKAKQEKAEKMKERKANNNKGKSLEEMMAYIDEDGNLSATPPDLKRKPINAQDISLSVSRPIEPEELLREGIVTYYNDEKGYGFITDSKTRENVFVHMNNAVQPLKVGNKVNFETARDKKGLHAVNVKKI